LAAVEDHEGEDEEMLTVGWEVVERKKGPRPASNTMGDHIAKAISKKSTANRNPCAPNLGSGERSLAPADEPAEAKPTVKTCSRFKPKKAPVVRLCNGFTALKCVEPDCQCDEPEQDDQRMKEKETSEEYKNEPQDDCISDGKLVDALVENFSMFNSLHSKSMNDDDDDMNIFEYEDDPLMPLGDDEVILEVTADTGAVDNVANPRELPGFAIRESAGSRNNKHFVGAGAERIKNEGEVKLSMEPVDGGKKLGVVFQAADITRALLSISKVCDSAPDTTVTFDSKAGVVKRKGKDIAKFYRKGGLYVMKVRVRKPKADADQPAMDFPRQGASR